LVAFYFVGFTLALIKQKLLMFCYETLVEHDGYVFKQFADLYHFAYLVGVDRHSIAGRLLKKLARLLLGSQIGRSITIIHLEGEAASLKSRYRKKGTHVEPADYISFQNKAFDRICNSFDGLIDGVIVKIEWNRPIADVHRDLMCCVTKSEYR
jgi:gluconate kinase